MIVKFCLVLLLVVLSTTVDAARNHKDIEFNNSNNINNLNRTRRAVSGFKGFFSLFGGITNAVVDQYVETRDTLNKLYEIFLDSFSDTARPTPPSYSQELRDGDNSTSTTTEKYRISRYEAGRIAGRNYRGLQKLLRIELNDALNQSNYNILDYQREIQNAFGTKNITITKLLKKRKRKLYKRAQK